MEININKKKVIGSFLVIISIGAIFYSAYVLGIKQGKIEMSATKSNTRSNSNESLSSSLPTTVPVTNKERIAEETVNYPEDAKLIKKGAIKWQEPVDVGDLGLTSSNLYKGCSTDCGQDNSYQSRGIKYVKSGEIVSGEYQGYELIIIASGVFEGPSSLPDMFRMLKKGNHIIFVLNKSSEADEYLANFIKEVFSAGSTQKEINNKIVIEELTYPEELLGINERQKFEKDPYAKAFFTDAKLKKAFVHDKYGQVWVTDEIKAINDNPTPLELNSYANTYNNTKGYYDIFSRHGFYIKAPDGTTVVYKMKFDIFDKNERTGLLQAVWNNGQKNMVAYEENPSGCGGGNYAYVETLKVNIDTDLVPVGKTDKGDMLYGYKNSDSSDFQKLYNEIYWVADEKEKKSPEAFLGIHPKVFWKDQFGRILAFYNTQIISPAECGKPVIYLYPEHDQEVSVKINPGNGLTKTVPEYGNGWKVWAQKNGDITNLSDGKNYPYLFWEGAGDVYYETPQEGFVVSKNELSQFFDDKLAQLGLLKKEIYDFKEFWIPEMEKSNHPYYFVTFLSKRYIDSLAPLEITPAPDSIIRVLMDYKGLNEYQTVPELKLKTPKRQGFCAVEWGGMLK